MELVELDGIYRGMHHGVMDMAVIFIVVIMIAGYIFSSRNAAVIAGTAILSSLMIFYEMNLLDPEITPLVPVLKSYC